MLDLMRKHAGTWMIKILLGAIVVVFVFWGVGSWTSHQRGIIATVNGQSISQEDYRAAYNRLVDQARQNFGNSLSEDLLKSLQIPQMALDQLIDRALLRQAADRLKLEVTDEELAGAVRSVPAFQSGGSFDRRRYQQVLSMNRMTPESFEAGQRDTLLLEKLSRVVTDGVKVSDSEVEEWYKWSNAEVKIDTVCLDTDRYKATPLTPEEVAAYYERSKESYRTEPEISVRYVVFSPDAFTGKVTVTEAEVRDYYEANAQRFEIPKTVEASHILIRLPADADPAAVQAAERRIQDILTQARAGKDFAELARQYSEDEGTRNQGGSLGAFPREAMIQPFADVAFGLPPGQISDPVRTRFGLHLIRVAKVNEGRSRSFDEVKPEIESTLKRERARTLAYDEAEAVYDAAAAANNDLAAAASARKLEAKTTGFFTRNAPPQGIGPAEQIAQSAFQLAAGELSEIQDFGGDYYLLQVADTRPARIPELAAVEAKVRQDLAQEKRREASRTDAQAVIADVGKGVALQQAAKQRGLAFRTSDFLKRRDPVGELGSEPEINRVAFDLTDSRRLAGEPVQTAKGYCVVQLVERRPPSAEGLEKERAQIAERLLQQKKYRFWESWMKDLRSGGRIERKADLGRV
jgi:peptidyl-prolyl cis-trans isomerase D